MLEGSDGAVEEARALSAGCRAGGETGPGRNEKGPALGRPFDLAVHSASGRWAQAAIAFFRFSSTLSRKPWVESHFC